MAFTQKPYALLDDVKAAGSITVSTDDNFLAALLSQAQTEIDAELGYSFQTDGTVAAPAQRTYNGNGSSQLLIDRCVSVSQVQTYVVGPDVTGALIRTAQTPSDITGDCLLGPVNASVGFLLERLTGASFPLGRRTRHGRQCLGMDQ